MQNVHFFVFIKGLIVLAFLSVTFDPTVTHADAQASSRPPAEIISVFPKDFPPYYITDENGQPAGFAIEVLDAVAKRSGLTIQNMPKETWMIAYQAFKSDQAQIIPSLSITKERKNDADVKIFKTLADLLSALNNKTVDAIIYPESVINTHFALNHTSKRIKSVGGPIKVIPRALAVRKTSPELLILLNRELKAFINTQAFDEIHRKWFNTAVVRTSFMSNFWWVG